MFKGNERCKAKCVCPINVMIRNIMPGLFRVFDVLVQIRVDADVPRKIMHDEQVAAFQAAGVFHYMWGWRMPMGGVLKRVEKL